MLYNIHYQNIHKDLIFISITTGGGEKKRKIKLGNMAPPQTLEFMKTGVLTGTAAITHHATPMVR